MILKRKSIILQAIKEDENDDANAITNGSMSSDGNDYASNNETSNDDDSNNTDNEETDNGSEENSNDDNKSDDNEFSIDTSLDGTSDDNSSDDSDSSDDTTDSSTSYSSDSSDAEVNDANTDIFTSLTAEEQQIKIIELKRNYQKLYEECNEYLLKINNTDIDANELLILNRVTRSINELKRYIKDYMISSFPYKSYIQNDIMFNRFLSILNSCAVVLDKMAKKDVTNK